MLKQEKTQGFTLVELITIAAVLAIIAVMLVPKFVDVSKDAKIEVLNGISGGMREALRIVYSKALIDEQTGSNGNIVINGNSLALRNGYPAVNGSDSFNQLNDKLQVWMNINSVSLTTIRSNNSAAQFFIDKISSQHIMFIFFSEDLSQKSVFFLCHIRYSNDPNNDGSPPVIQAFTQDC